MMETNVEMEDPTRCQAALEVSGLKVRFGEFQAISGVDLTIDVGELRVLIGANGAGKSTLLDVICGKTPASEGEIRVLGSSIIGKSEPQIVDVGVGRKFQTPALFQDLTVWQNLEIARRLPGSSMRDLFRRVRGWGRDQIDETLELVGLIGQKNLRVDELSHGQHQWLDLGILLVQNPRLILLDEPTAGMTAAETRLTAKIISGMRGRHTLLVVEHDMAFVRDICKTITVLHQGRVIATGAAQEIENDPAVIEAYLGKSGVTRA